MSGFPLNNALNPSAGGRCDPETRRKLISVTGNEKNMFSRLQLDTETVVSFEWNPVTCSSCL